LEENLQKNMAFQELLPVKEKTQRAVTHNCPNIAKKNILLIPRTTAAGRKNLEGIQLLCSQLLENWPSKTKK